MQSHHIEAKMKQTLMRKDTGQECNWPIGDGQMHKITIHDSLHSLPRNLPGKKY